MQREPRLSGGRLRSCPPASERDLTPPPLLRSAGRPTALAGGVGAVRSELPELGLSAVGELGQDRPLASVGASTANWLQADFANTILRSTQGLAHHFVPIDGVAGSLQFARQRCLPGSGVVQRFPHHAGKVGWYFQVPLC